MSASPRASQPLAGTLVVDLSRYLPGPLAAQILASLGARVIKVEEPTLGDPVRLAPPHKRGQSALAAPLLSGLESIALDLKKEGARAALLEVLAGADVLLETFRPGTLARLGLAPVELCRRFPRLVVASLSGFGQDGPLAARAGHDLTYQALAGTLAPTATTPAVPLADLLGAWTTTTAVLAALAERGKSGHGAWIDASLFDAATHAGLVGWAAEVGRPRQVGEPHGLSGELACYGVYDTAGGGKIALALLEPHFWRRFCVAVDRRDLVRHHLSRERSARAALAALFKTRDRDAWAELFATHDLPGAPVLSPAEAAAHPQQAARDLLRRGPDGLPRLAFPARFDGLRPASGAKVPRLGADTRAVLAEAGHVPGGGPRRSGVGARPSLKRLLARWLLRG